MWAIIDNRAPKEAIEKLKETFDVLEFMSEDITYEEVSGHPDIFIFQDKNKLIIAPNSPQELIAFLTEQKVKFIFGNKKIGKELNNTTQYNCSVTRTKIFHKRGFTDDVVLLNNQNKKLIELPQAYTRCSLTILNNNSFITSDKGIEKVLLKEDFNILLVNSSSINLPGYPYGFFGGTNGILNNTLYLIGSLKYIENGEEIKSRIVKNNIKLIELYEGPLYDGGGIFMGE